MATVRNQGDAGPIRMLVGLSSSEGEWTREQTLIFEAGETRELTYLFLEPTIDATNIQCTLNTTP